jgi:hypothetical protein
MLAAQPANPNQLNPDQVNPLIRQAPVAVQRRYIQGQLESGEPFAAILLDGPGPKGSIQVTGPSGDPEMVNPVTIARHGEVVDYAAVTQQGGRSHIEMLAARGAEAQAYIGNRAVNRAVLKLRVIRAVGDTGIGATGFTDGRDTYGVEP